MREKFYYTAQGSKIIPYDWAMALNVAGADEAFFTSQNLKKFGYIPQAASKANPDALPVGFTYDQNPAGFTKADVKSSRVQAHASLPQLGINCAACHTSELSVGSTKLRIEGGPSYSNFQMFTRAMDQAVLAVATRNGPGEENFTAFQGFASRLNKRTTRKALESLPTAEQNRLSAWLRASLADFNSGRQLWQKNNGLDMAGITYGPARNDAFGVIFNQALGAFLNDPSNIRPASAPVKYPVIWDAPYHDKVQWIGIARNSQDAGGPIARNIGQVLGVFGHSDVYDRSLTHGYCTSAKRAELNAFESWMRTLRSPTWPQSVPGFAFDIVKARKGASHYQQNCAGCHSLNERTLDEAVLHKNSLGIKDFAVYQPFARAEKKANEHMIPIEGEHGVHTDPLTAENAFTREANAGILTGRPVKVLSGRPLERIEPAATVLRHVVAGSILGSFSDITCANTPRDYRAVEGLTKKIVDSKLGFSPQDLEASSHEARMAAFKAELGSYKARPLNGIWAAPPYLHNGSIRSLRQLLTKPADREDGFDFTCNEYDPVEVGLNCSADKVNDKNRVFDGKFRFEARNIRGNSNQGHPFGTELSDDEKSELIEYIKAL